MAPMIVQREKANDYKRIMKSSNKSKKSNDTPQFKNPGDNGTAYFRDHREHSDQLHQLQSMANAYIDGQIHPIQKKENNTGLPDQLKSGVESLSGYSLDDVKVHYNSDKPSQLNAHAYAQGNQIHVAPGQEKHLPHETWHVVQQKQGRVKPTNQLGGVAINDNAGLEKEADQMGRQAIQLKVTSNPELDTQKLAQQTPLLVLQRLENGEVIQLEVTDYLKAGMVEGQPVMHGIGLLGTAASFAFNSTIGHGISAVFHGAGSIMAIAKLIYDLYTSEGTIAHKKKIAMDVVNILTGLGLTAGDIVAFANPLVGGIITAASNATRGIATGVDVAADKKDPTLSEDRQDAKTNQNMFKTGNAAFSVLMSPFAILGVTGHAPALSLLHIVSGLTNLLQGGHAVKKAGDEKKYSPHREGYDAIN